VKSQRGFLSNIWKNTIIKKYYFNKKEYILIKINLKFLEMESVSSVILAEFYTILRELEIDIELDQGISEIIITTLNSYSYSNTFESNNDFSINELLEFMDACGPGKFYNNKN
jgi:hypothetical protein